jgi:tetratricopeptide (TPR) repeat protein
MLKQPDQAVLDLEAAGRGPEVRDVLMLLGRAQAELGELSKAEASLRRALAIRSDHEAHLNLGRLHVAQGRLPEALEDFRAGLRAAPGHAGALVDLGTVLLALGRAAEAIGPLREATKADGLNAQAFLALGQAQAATGQRREAEDALQTALLLDPGLATTYLELSALYRAAGALDRAIATLERGLERRPGEPALAARLTELRALRRAPRS